MKDFLRYFAQNNLEDFAIKVHPVMRKNEILFSSVGKVIYCHSKNEELLFAYKAMIEAARKHLRNLPDGRDNPSTDPPR